MTDGPSHRKIRVRSLLLLSFLISWFASETLLFIGARACLKFVNMPGNGLSATPCSVVCQYLLLGRSTPNGWSGRGQRLKAISSFIVFKFRFGGVPGLVVDRDISLFYFLFSTGSRWLPAHHYCKDFLF